MSDRVQAVQGAAEIGDVRLVGSPVADVGRGFVTSSKSGADRRTSHARTSWGTVTLIAPTSATGTARAPGWKARDHGRVRIPATAGPRRLRWPRRDLSPCRPPSPRVSGKPGLVVCGIMKRRRPEASLVLFVPQVG